MPQEISELRANPSLEVAGQTVYSGTFRITLPGLGVVRTSDPAQPFAFFVPDTAPLDQSAATPEGILAETWLMACRSVGSTGVDIGVEQVAAAYAPDPRGGSQRWLQLSGTAHAARGILVGYRVTVVHY